MCCLRTWKGKGNVQEERLPHFTAAETAWQHSVTLLLITSSQHWMSLLAWKRCFVRPRIQASHWGSSDKWLQSFSVTFSQHFSCMISRYEYIIWLLISFLKKKFDGTCGDFFSSSQWKVRRTLAFSIHELAVILGDQLTAADLVPIFNGFLKDLDEVRIGVLKHLYDFLKVRL